jgi:hypothetical protein
MESIRVRKASRIMNIVRTGYVSALCALGGGSGDGDAESGKRHPPTNAEAVLDVGSWRFSSD